MGTHHSQFKHLKHGNQCTYGDCHPSFWQREWGLHMAHLPPQFYLNLKSLTVTF